MEGKFITIFALSILAAISASAVAQDSAAAPAAEPPVTFDFTEPPEPYSGFFESTDKCFEKLTEKCGDEIMYGVLDKGKVSEGCCTKLITVGQKCRELIMEEFLFGPFMTEDMRRKIEENAAEMWESCMAVADIPAGAPNPVSD